MRPGLLAILTFLFVSQDLSAQVVSALQRDYLQVLDANRNLVGYSSDTGSGPQPLRVILGYQAAPGQRVDSIVVPLVWVGSDYLQERYQWAEGVLYYESADCTGQGYIESSANARPNGRLLGAVMDDNILYASAPDPPLELKNFASVELGGQGCSATVRKAFAAAANSTGVDLDTVWLLPFFTR